MDTFINVIEMLPEKIRDEISKIELTQGEFSRINEIRIRVGQPCSYRISDKAERVVQGSFYVDNYLLNETINKFINYSYYAYEEELKNGYITLFGGHRAGICGRAVIDNGRVSLISNISSINIRHAREYIGISDEFTERFFGKDLLKNSIFPSTLIVSPPGCGKTTFLRDIIRNLSVRGFNIGVCDERSEIAGMHLGQPSFELGPNTDVMDGCPKAEGMKMLLRSMAPDIIATDEIGKAEDVDALSSALVAGTGIIATMHGSSMEDLKKSALTEVIEEKVFKRIVFLSKQPRPCTIREVYSAK